MNYILSLVFLFSCLSKQILCSNSSETAVIYTIEHQKISAKTAQKLVEKYQDPKTDMLSLLLDHPDPSCLQVMKELRIQDKKNKDPLSHWKLLQVISEKEIYFEAFYQRPSKKYILHQLIKRDHQFYHTTLSYEGSRPNPKQASVFLNIVQNKHVG